MILQLHTTVGNEIKLLMEQIIHGLQPCLAGSLGSVSVTCSLDLGQSVFGIFRSTELFFPFCMPVEGDITEVGSRGKWLQCVQATVGTAVPPCSHGASAGTFPARNFRLKGQYFGCIFRGTARQCNSTHMRCRIPETRAVPGWSLCPTPIDLLHPLPERRHLAYTQSVPTIS